MISEENRKFSKRCLVAANYNLTYNHFKFRHVLAKYADLLQAYQNIIIIMEPGTKVVQDKGEKMRSFLTKEK